MFFLSIFTVHGPGRRRWSSERYFAYRWPVEAGAGKESICVHK